MHLDNARLQAARVVPSLTAASAAASGTATESQVQGGLCLFLPLKNPAQMPALLTMLRVRQAAIHETLRSLASVHFARFVPTPDGSALLVITEYDGEMKPYVMDFASVLQTDFTAILEFVRDAPRLPVEKYPDDFWRFIESHNVGIEPFSAYPKATVLDILARDPQ
jgi:hypothetical protein